LSDTTDVTSEVSATSADSAEAGATRRRRSGTGLSGMLLPELQSLAASLGISGTARMRKGELVAAIQERQAGDAAPKASTSTRSRASRTEAPEESWPSATEGAAEPKTERAERPRRATRAAGPPEPRVATDDQSDAAPSGAERSTGERTAERTGRATERSAETVVERVERTIIKKEKKVKKDEEFIINIKYKYDFSFY
jgi:transcription termination factor Rho